MVEKGKLRINMGKSPKHEEEGEEISSRLKINMGKFPKHEEEAPKHEEKREETSSRLKINMGKPITPSEMLEKFRSDLEPLKEYNENTYSLYPEICGKEDAPAIATKISIEDVDIFVNSVADGLGGSGGRMVMIDGDTLLDKGKTVTHAYIASRTAHYVLSQIIKNNPKALVNNNFKEVFEEKLNQEFQKLKKIFGERTKKLKGVNYPTTLATSIIQRDKTSTKVQCLSIGDSPIFIITPDCVYTSLEEETGDATLGNDIVCSDKKINLKHKEFSFDIDVPIIVVNCSDGFVKFVIPESEDVSDIEKAFKEKTLNIKKIFEFLKLVLTSNIEEEYEDWSKGKEPDDSTISVSDLTTNPEIYNKLLENLKEKQIKQIF